MIALVLGACTVNPAERNNTGNRLTADGDYDEAVMAYQAAQVVEPDNWVVYLNSAQALTGAERVADAQMTLDLVIENGEPDLVAEAWYILGNVYYQQDELEQAINSYREALRVDPNHDDARYNLELANLMQIEPTPTAIEMQSEIDEENVDQQATPTPNPAGQIQPTPTPTLQNEPPPPGPSPESIGEEESGEESQFPSTPEPFSDGEMDVEDAANILQPIEAFQENISTFRENNNETGEQGTDQDW
ncbi:MAG: tetratricopeptide repeat protein [Anaerolineae bacterium]